MRGVSPFALSMVAGVTRSLGRGGAILALTFAVGFSAAPAVARTVVIDAPAGRLRGVSGAEATLFRGVPYAQAPVGPLRWRPPRPMTRWRGVRDASSFGPACLQPPSPFYDHAATSEDCLFLNISAPPGAWRAPVLVWIHGGSLVSGAGSEPLFDGAAFARRGVLVVSINYRLGALGWLGHPGLSAETPDHLSGNYGLMDQIEALRWVRRNIAVFGGDPDRVTIAGESAGALSVVYLMTAPQARGLFHGAIAQSAYLITQRPLRNGPYADWPDAETMGASLAGALGAADVAGLRALSGEAIVAGTATSGWFPLGTVDGRWLPRQPIDIFDAGEQARVPLLAGYNEGEIRSLRFLLPPAPATSADYEREIRERYGDLSADFLAAYPAADRVESMLATTRDALYGWTAERLAASQTAAGAPAFLYEFDHGWPSAEAKDLRAFHGSEIPFVFGALRTTPAWWPATTGGEDLELSEAMTDYWASFVRTGRPSSPGAAAWPVYDDRRSYMAFEDVPRARRDLPTRFRLHEAVVCRRRREGRVAWHWNVGVISPILPARQPGCG